MVREERRGRLHRAVAVSEEHVGAAVLVAGGDVVTLAIAIHVRDDTGSDRGTTAAWGQARGLDWRENAAAVVEPRLNSRTAAAKDHVWRVVTIQVADRDGTNAEERHPVVRGRELRQSGQIIARVDERSDEGVVHEVYADRLVDNEIQTSVEVDVARLKRTEAADVRRQMGRQTRVKVDGVGERHLRKSQVALDECAGALAQHHAEPVLPVGNHHIQLAVAVDVAHSAIFRKGRSGVGRRGDKGIEGWRLRKRGIGQRKHSHRRRQRDRGKTLLGGALPKHSAS